MPALILPRRFYSQPQGAVEVDWNNPLVAAIQPTGIWLPTGGGVVNLVDRSLAEAVNDAAISAYSLGRSTETPENNTTDSTTNTTTQFWNSGKKATPDHRFLAVWAKYLSAPAVADYHIGSHDATRRFYISPAAEGGTTAQLIFGWGGSTAPTTNTRTPPAAGQEEMLAMVVAGTGQTDNSVIGYIDGQHFDTKTGVSWTGGDSTRNIYLGARTHNSATENNSITRCMANQIGLAIAGLGQPDAAAIQELHSNPWQIVKARKRVLYFDVAAPSAAPTLSFPLATSITSSSAVPQVTLTF